MKNVIIIVIDALSKWYIDQYKKDGGFFSNLEENGYTALNMFSGAPFTEGAVHEFWASEDTFMGLINPAERHFGNDPLPILFKKNGYYIYADDEFRMNMNNRIPVDSWSKTDIQGTEGRALTRLMAIKIPYYIRLWDTGEFTSDDYWKIETLLTDFFESGFGYETAEAENNIFQEDKVAYINDILENKAKSSFYKNLGSTEKISKRKFPLSSGFNMIQDTSLSDIEKLFVMEAKYKNLEFLYQMEKESSTNDPKYFEEILWADQTNRCIQTNNDLSYTLRNSYNKKSLKDSLSKFIEWYDKLDVQTNASPFFAYIHTSVFHYPASFTENMYGDAGYEAELMQKRKEVENMQWKKMSVSKQLSLSYIEKQLENFWSALTERDFFKDSYIILTADHGISNFMYQKLDSKHRWNYTKINFQVPFYMQGCDITPYKDYGLRSAKDIIPILTDMCSLNTYKNNYIGTKDCADNIKYISTAWINGEPDLDRRKIRMGIRNKKFSITWESYITQFWATGRTPGVYDLEKDPDERVDIGEFGSTEEAYTSLLDQLKSQWFDKVLSVLANRENIWGAKKDYDFLVANREYYENLNRNLHKENWNELNQRIHGRKLILYGKGSSLKDFICDTQFTYEIEEIWDEEAKPNEYFLGSKVCKPHADISDCLIIITGDNELKAVEALRKMVPNHDFTFSKLII